MADVQAAEDLMTSGIKGAGCSALLQKSKYTYRVFKAEVHLLPLLLFLLLLLLLLLLRVLFFGFFLVGFLFCLLGSKRF